jgi:cold-inducible RNA-binding protein
MSTKLNVGNLPFSATEEDLMAKFGQFGIVASATLMKDAVTGRSKRFAVIEMISSAAASAAIRRLNMSQYDEQTMSVSMAPGA